MVSVEEFGLAVIVFVKNVMEMAVAFSLVMDIQIGNANAK